MDAQDQPSVTDHGGEHDDWDDYFAAMVRDRRLVLRIHPERAYGMIP